MKRVDDISSLMAWLEDRPRDEVVTGFGAVGWPASTWVVHAMYENSALAGLGTQDDLLRRLLDTGEVAPRMVGDINIDAVTNDTRTPLGYVSRPERPFVRVSWREYLERHPDFGPRLDVPPGGRWFPPGSFPVAIQPPPEGSLDEESLEALIGVLAAHSSHGRDTECLAFYASLPAGFDFDNVHLWAGPLRHIPDLIDDNGGPYRFSPTNFWSVGREWFVWTDYDLQATKVSGAPALIAALAR